jgi:hypothetical protein
MLRNNNGGEIKKGKDEKKRICGREYKGIKNGIGGMGGVEWLAGMWRRAERQTGTGHPQLIE